MASRKIPASLNLLAVLLTSNRHSFGDFLCASKESYPPQAEALHLEAKAKSLDPCFRRDAERKVKGSPPRRGCRAERRQGHWIPIFAGMTSKDTDIDTGIQIPTLCSHPPPCVRPHRRHPLPMHLPIHDTALDPQAQRILDRRRLRRALNASLACVLLLVA